jgi:hypothetical protein
VSEQTPGLVDEPWFVDVSIETDGQTLADNAIAALQARWPGWQPNDGDLEVVLIEMLSQMAASAAQGAGIVPAAIFRAYGTDLIGLPYQDGTKAITTVTFTVKDNAGYVIPAGSAIAIDDFEFTTDLVTTIAAGATTAAGVAVTAAEIGTAYNTLAGATVAPITSLSFVTGITVDTPTHGGVEAQTDLDYQAALSAQLLLQAKTLVVARDYELWALAYAGIGRAVAQWVSDRTVRVTIADNSGEVVATPTKTALAADYALYQQVNTVTTIADPTYTTIGVDYTVHPLPGFDTADLLVRINAMIRDQLSPANWGRPKSGDPALSLGWVSDTTVRVYRMVDRIGDIEGVDYVTAVTLTGSAGTLQGNGDWLMPGNVPLPRAGTIGPGHIV